MAEHFGSTWSTPGFVALGTLAIYFTLLIGVRLAGRSLLRRKGWFDVDGLGLVLLKPTGEISVATEGTRPDEPGRKGPGTR